MIYFMEAKKILIYDPRCPKCRFLGKLVRFFDFGGKFTFYPIATREASEILHDFYRNIPYNFHFIIDHKDLCYTGIKAIPAVLYELIAGLFWPFGGNGPHWLRSKH